MGHPMNGSNDGTPAQQLVGGVTAHLGNDEYRAREGVPATHK